MSYPVGLYNFENLRSVDFSIKWFHVFQRFMCSCQPPQSCLSRTERFLGDRRLLKLPIRLNFNIKFVRNLNSAYGPFQVGTFAENLLETLSENAQVKKVIAGVRKQTREEKKRLAMAMRAKQLETLGLEATAAGRMVKTSSNHTPNFDDIVDETGLKLFSFKYNELFDEV